MILIIAGPYIGFPHGRAPTSRVTSYARGLAACGKDVRVILLGPSEKERATARNVDPRGFHKGIPFEYTSCSTVRSTWRVRRLVSLPEAILVARRLIREAGSERGVEAVLLYSSSVMVARMLRSAVRRVRATYAVDVCEMPRYEDPEGLLRRRRQAWYGRVFISVFDVVFAISTRLLNYTSQHLDEGAEAVLLPVMVDCDEYDADGSPSQDLQIITYTGVLIEAKDGVMTLIEAFSLVAGDFPRARLRLVGDSPDYLERSQAARFRSHAESLGVADRVEFAGTVPRSEVPRYLSEATVLALARPSNHQTEAGLPTKLGEYLASGRPVVVTTTSDIAAYLSDGQSAYLAPPNNVDAFASALRRALSDPEQATRIGRAGRSVAQAYFDYRVCGLLVSEALGRHQPSVGHD